jgi:hypothetical protein
VTVLALVGMHHIAAVGCSAVIAEHGIEHSAGIAESGPATLAANEHTGAPGDVPFEMVCLAVIIIVGLMAHRIRILFRRSRRSKGGTVESVDRGRVPDPPDLNALSLSRT